MKAGKIISGVLAIILAVLAAFFIYLRFGAELLDSDDTAFTPAEPTTQSQPASPAPQDTTPAQTEEPTVEETPEPTEEPKNSELPDIDITSWEFILANADNNIGEYTPELEFVENGQQMDARVVDAMKDFIDAARSRDLSVYFSSAYRGYAEQNYLYERKVEQYGGDRAKAATIVLPPGTSEHQTGLCADITDRYYELKNSELENTALFKWMNEHCAEYGFILRYPNGKGDITGVIYEPWHFRYVGVEAAAYIQEHGLCLEEFIDLYK